MIKTITIDDEKWRVVPLMPDEKMIEAGDSIRHGRIKTSIIYMHMIAVAPQPEPVESAMHRYNKHTEGDAESDPVERLRFFLSLALKGQDWIDVERFINDLKQIEQETGEVRC